MLLAACTHDPVVTGADTVAAGNWRIERSADRITGAPISSALLPTRTVSHTSIVVPPAAQMQLTCFKGQPAVVMAFQFTIGSTRNSELSYRFDEKPGHLPKVRFVDDYKKVIIEDPAEVSLFVSELAASKSLYVLIRSLNGGRTSAEFQLDGAPAAIESGLAGCPVNQPAKRASLSPPLAVAG